MGEIVVESGAKRKVAMNDTKTALSENAMKVLERRYLSKNEQGGIIETPSQLFRRVARNIAQADTIFEPNADFAEIEDEFYRMMATLEFLPNSPTLMNAGRELQQLSACFVLPIEDSMESIFETVKDTALIHKSGGGTGFSFSRLRPAGGRVRSTSGVSSGPVTFMRVFDAATESVKQGGTRRGANMGILRVDHPDVMEFISCKADGREFTNFNISVAITDEFMDALMEKREYDLIDPNTKAVVGRLSAVKVMDTIIHHAWKNGDPGVVFIDRINKDNPTPQVGEIESTNPCGEQPLLPYESCNLGSVNLTKFVKKGAVDWVGLERIVHSAVHFLDNVIDMNRYPIAKIEKMTKANRKIGLGVMGFADMLIMLGIPYNSDAAVEMGEKVMHFLDAESKKASQKLAEKRGAFPNFRGSVYDKPGAPKLRNATTTTIAPTGTISIIAGVSSGIEPLFAVSYIRTVMDNDKLVETHPLFEQVAHDKGFYSADLMKTIAHKGSVHGVKGVPDDVAKVFVTSHEISPEWHIRMQAAFQKHTDNAVSKTVNFANNATEENVKDAYMLSYDMGCKGVTIYRDGSRDGQVLSTGKTGASKEAKPAAEHKLTTKARPSVVRGSTQRFTTGCGKIYVTVNEDEKGNPFEMFVQIGKAGGCAASQTESIGRLVSLALRSGIDASELKKNLVGISCHMPAWDNGGKILSCADAIGKALANFGKTDPGVETNVKQSGGAKGNGNGGYDAVISAGACPDCGGSLEYAEGCMTCRGCGYSKCG
jgi:ribonucleoside-diphosphate reductase alpha chain